MGEALPKRTVPHEVMVDAGPQAESGPAKIAFAVVVPAFNEGPNLARLVPEIFDALNGQDAFQVSVVDDASTDDTAAVLTGLQERYPNLLVTRHGERAGQSRGIWTGIRASEGAWVVTLDGDGQNDPADIPKLLEIAQGDMVGDLGLVQGIRTERRDTLSKRAASKLANGIRGRLLGDACPDTGCGLKVVRRELYEALPYFDSRHRFMPALVKGWGWRTEFVPVNDRPRTAGTSKYTNWRRGLVGIVDMAGVIWLLKRTKRPPVAPPASPR
jgi:dolichol-phosphate mannosyltransferase